MSGDVCEADVAVVGCGIAGMAAALLLARAGRRVRVFERFETAEPRGAGFLLQPTGMGVLASLGLYERVRAAGAPVDRLIGQTARGKRIVDLPYADFDPRYYGLGVHRGVVFQALYDALLAEPAIALETGRAAARAAPEGRITFEDGSEAGPFAVVIAADGAASPLRQAAGAARRDRPYAWACVWTIAEDPGDLLAGGLGRTLDQRYDGGRRFAGVLPIGRPPGRERRAAAVFWSLRADAYPAWRAQGLAAWKAEMADFFPRCAALIDATTDIDALPLAVYRDVTQRRPYHGRRVFLGDAGHAMSPQLGQGANLALLDALALARALERRAPAADADAAALERAFAAYWAARRAQRRWYSLASRWLTPVFQSSNPLWGWGRDLLFGPVSRIGVLRREMLGAQAGMKAGFFQFDRRDWTPGRPAPPDPIVSDSRG